MCFVWPNYPATPQGNVMKVFFYGSSNLNLEERILQWHIFALV